MIRGIFRCDNSLIAICRASVSPSKGTRTGAFMLFITLSQASAESRIVEQPYLQSSCSQYPCPFILGKVRRRYAHFIWLLFTSNPSSSCRFFSISHLLVSINSIHSTSIYTVFTDMQSFLTRLFSGNFAVLQVVCKKVIAFVLDQERPATKNT